MMQSVVAFLLLSAAAAQLATQDVVKTPILDMVQKAVGQLKDSDSVEALKEKVEKVKAAKQIHAEAYKNLVKQHGLVDSKPKLAHAFRQTVGQKGGSQFLNACMENDACIDTLYERLDTNNDGHVDAEEYSNYMVNDGTDSADLKEKRKAAAKVLRTLRTADVNGDNVISPQEFEQWREELDLVDDSALSYETFDSDQDGEVSKSEFARAILKLAESKQNSDEYKTVKDVVQGAEALFQAAKKHSNLEASFGNAATINFEQRLKDVPEIELEDAMDKLQQANEKVLKINEEEKVEPQFVIKLEDKKYRLEGSSKDFYRHLSHLIEKGFNAQKAQRAMIAADGHEGAAQMILCQSEEAEDTEICDQLEPNVGENSESETQGTSFVEGVKAMTEQEQDALDAYEERTSKVELDDGTPVESEILLPEPNKELPRFRQMKQDVMHELVESLTEKERQALLSQKGKKHLRQLMPKHADSFVDGVSHNEAMEKDDKSDALSHVVNVAKAAVKPAIDVADLGIQMVLGPKNEFLTELPDKADAIMTKWNKYVGF